MEKLKRKKHKTGYPNIILGILLIGISSFILINKTIKNIKNNDTEKKSIETFLRAYSPCENNINKTEVKKSEVINYIAVLEIPKINLKRGLLDINNNKNNIDYNIAILKESTMPDIKYGNFILASHSGNSNVSFFKNINKLDIDDLITIYYKNNIYNYKVSKVYEIEKNGKMSFELDNINTYITLITCIPKTDKQLVVVGTKV